MNWNSYLKIFKQLQSKNLLAVETLQSRCLHNNAFRMYDSNYKMGVSNNYYDVFEKQYIEPKLKNSSCLNVNPYLTGDFVWSKSNNTIYTYKKMGGINAGTGHPGLTTAGSTDCAGRIIPKTSTSEKYGSATFFFHSGHFRPKIRHAIVFMCNFIKASYISSPTNPNSYNALLDKICNNMKLTFYPDDSEDYTMHSTFTQICNTFIQNNSSAVYSYTPLYNESTNIGYHSRHSTPIGIPSKSKFHSQKSTQFYNNNNSNESKMNDSNFLSVQPFIPPRSQPVTIGSNKSHNTSKYSHYSSYRSHNSNINNFGTQSLKPQKMKISRVWISDDESDNCQKCETKFNFFNRKHHCRYCGALICGLCSRQKLFGSVEALQSDDTTVPVNKTKTQRICTTCESNWSKMV
ncbi:MAG: hypothetical protein GY750_08035 [Lentisphaerae bacterium]|nr:hypothetical protein [Lentisphaerota bacterium]MCP4101357.1 hypothetical protein [Lentisphaerota bacterium]